MRIAIFFSKPDGDSIPVHFTNNRKLPVELFWMSPDNTPKRYGMIEPGSSKEMRTRAGAVWIIQDSQTKAPRGYFVVGDRTAQAMVPATSQK